MTKDRGVRADPRTAFWRSTQRLSACLLLLWFGVTLLVPWFARDVQTLTVFGLPLGYWGTATGALLVYLVIVVVYSIAMDRLERQFQRDRSAAPPAVEPP